MSDYKDDEFISSIKKDGDLNKKLQTILSDNIDSEKDKSKSLTLSKKDNKNKICKYMEVNLYSNGSYYDPSKDSIHSMIKLDGKNLIGIKIGFADNYQINALQAAAATPYSIKVNNLSGRDQTIGIFQVDPLDDPTGFPLVWASKGVAEDGKGTFRWSTEWGITWGEALKLNNGVHFEGEGPIIGCAPDSSSQNGVNITYNKDKEVWDMKSADFASLPAGSIRALTDDSFDNITAERANFSISVTMDKKATFAMEGLPNTTYTFRTHPTYYLSTIANKTGVSVDGSTISKSSAVVFMDGYNDMECDLNRFNEFENFRPV